MVQMVKKKHILGKVLLVQMVTKQKRKVSSFYFGNNSGFPPFTVYKKMNQMDEIICLLTVTLLIVPKNRRVDKEKPL